MPRHARVPQRYEMMVLIAPTVTEEGLPAVVDRVGAYVTDQGGEISSFTYENPWGRRRLAYPIQNFNDAYYVLYFFTAPPQSIQEIERMVRLDDVIIRHLLVKYDPLSERYDHEGTPFDPRPEPAAEPEAEAEPVAAGVAAEASGAEGASASASADSDSETATAVAEADEPESEEDADTEDEAVAEAEAEEAPAEDAEDESTDEEEDEDEKE